MPDVAKKVTTRSTHRTVSPTPSSESLSGLQLRQRMVEEPAHVDTGLVLTIVLMLCFGLVMLFSASMSASISQTSEGTSYLFRQLTANLIGLGFIILITKFNIKVFDRIEIAAFVYVLSTMLVFLTLFSTPINGARRWLSIPLFGSFQPTELHKVVMVYTLACYESWLNKQRALRRFKQLKGLKGALRDAWLDILLPCIIIFLPLLIVLYQPHVSGFLIITIVSFICLLASGLRLRSWLVSGAIGLLLIGMLAGFFVVFHDQLPESLVSRYDHVVTRLEIFTGSEDVTEDELYQTRQARIAIGSGGWTGVGLAQGKQKYNYLPEGHNDYIFSNLVEETGFIGGIAVILLFLIFFILGMRVAFRASSVYSQIVATGISSLITIQALLNIGVNVEAIPPTGISLPFFSYGGTSNMFFLIGVGLLLNVSKYGVRVKEETQIVEASHG